MLIVAAKIITAPGKRDAFIKAAQPCIAATRKEGGCILYELYASSEDENKLLYYEHWKSRADLDKHLVAEHMKQFEQVKKDQGLQSGDTEIGIFEVA